MDEFKTEWLGLQVMDSEIVFDIRMADIAVRFARNTGPEWEVAVADSTFNVEGFNHVQESLIVNGVSSSVVAYALALMAEGGEDLDPEFIEAAYETLEPFLAEHGFTGCLRFIP